MEEASFAIEEFGGEIGDLGEEGGVGEVLPSSATMVQVSRLLFEAETPIALALFRFGMS